MVVTCQLGMSPARSSGPLSERMSSVILSIHRIGQYVDHLDAAITQFQTSIGSGSWKGLLRVGFYEDNNRSVEPPTSSASLDFRLDQCPVAKCGVLQLCLDLRQDVVASRKILRNKVCPGVKKPGRGLFEESFFLRDRKSA